MTNEVDEMSAASRGSANVATGAREMAQAKTERVTFSVTHAHPSGELKFMRHALAEAFLDCCSLGIVVDRWIPVEERMPEDGVVVMTWSGKRVCFGYARYGQWIDTLYGWVIPNGPTHWMPLPAPPTDTK